MLGGYKQHDDHENDAHVQEIAKFAVQQVSENGTKLELLKVLSAHTQVVAGTNYKLLLSVADANNQKKNLEVTVYEPIGSKELKLTDSREPSREEVEHASEASSERNKGGLLGGYKEAATDDRNAAAAAAFAAQQLSEQSNSLRPLAVQEVVTARTRVENGLVFDLTLKLGQGGLPPQLYRVEVARDLKNQFRLLSTKSA
ncbi:hypothetical protein WJX81_002249 [Elliptochloris bilobata]|uniref:Cystatin domain-containing protein n=1 Tax=Elliptochloris bilobata TaxID=381761 RepID=A0AAW1QIM0_9CHLO